jgi:hypothetical protein
MSYDTSRVPKAVTEEKCELLFHNEISNNQEAEFSTLLIPMPSAGNDPENVPSNSDSPGSNPGLVMWDLWRTKWRWGRFSPSTSVSPANLHSTNFSTITITYHLGLVQ